MIPRRCAVALAHALACLALAGCASWFHVRSVPGETILPDRPVVVAMSVDECGLAYVPVRVDGKGPFWFLVDTGCSLLVVDNGLRYHLDLVGEPVARDIIGGSTTASTSGWEGSIGDLTLVGASGTRAVMRDVPWRSLELKLADGDGVLGIALFEAGLVRLDYPRGELTFVRGSLPAADGRHVLDYRLPNGIPAVVVRVGDVEIEAALDTGFNGVLSVPPAIAARLDLDPDEREETEVFDVHGTQRGEVRRLTGRLAVGALEVRRPQVLVSSGQPLIGCSLLAHCALTFDGRHQRVRLEPSSPRPRHHRAGVAPGADADGAGPNPLSTDTSPWNATR